MFCGNQFVKEDMFKYEQIAAGYKYIKTYIQT